MVAEHFYNQVLETISVMTCSTNYKGILEYKARESITKIFRPGLDLFLLLFIQQKIYIYTRKKQRLEYDEKENGSLYVNSIDDRIFKY